MRKIKSLLSLLLCLVITLSCVSVFAERYVTLYTEDGRAKSFPESQVAAQLTVGWYKTPVQRLYAADGRSKVFPRNEVYAQTKVGWYTEPVQTLYSPGQSKVFKKTEVAAQLTVGWYTYPVTKMWALDGRSKVIPTTQVAANQKVGWYTTYGYIIAKANALRDTEGYASATDWLETKYLQETLITTNERNSVKAKLDEFCAIWYGKNTWIPVGIYKSYVTTDKDGEPVANFHMRNLCKKEISNITIEFTCYDAYGNPTDDYEYIDTTVKKVQFHAYGINYWQPSTSVTGDTALYSNSATKKIGNIKIKEIKFKDGSTWSR